MSFYNPYQSTPDIGQGFSDLASQIIQFMLLNKYMGGEGGGKLLGKKKPKAMLEGTGVGGIKPGVAPIAPMTMDDAQRQQLTMLLQQYLSSPKLPF